MAALATQSITLAGTAPAYAAASGGGDTFTPGFRTFLHVKNASGGALTVTVVTPGNVRTGLTVGDVAISVPAAGERMIGPLQAEYFADSALSGSAQITYSGVTSLTIGAFDLSS